VASFLRVPSSTSVEIKQLAAQADLFRQVRAFCDPNLNIERVAGSLREEAEDDEADHALALVKRVRYGETEILISVGLSGTTRIGTEEQGRTVFEMANPRTLFVRPNMDLTDDESADASLEATEASFEEMGLKVIRMDDPWDRALGSDRS